MQLSRKADYALRAVRFLSTQPKGKLGSINAIAASESDVFLACPMIKGYGYAVWRIATVRKDSAVAATR